ncbi:MAG: hypothetical protein DMF78_03265 [Acidobacteria bacterium]|nr:MAG: hypothetical protein DMF78_03265 [Acidobacteriota bacterium]
MSGRQTVFALTLAMAVVPVLAAADDHAVPRGGGSSSSSAGEHHSGGSSATSSGGSSSSYSGSGDRESSPPMSDAQRRHPRPGTGTGDHFSGRNNYYYGSPFYYGRRYYYDAYDPFYYGYYGYSPFYYSGSYGYAPYYYRGRYRDSGSMRVIVDPDQTRVYVDGYYAGIADDFDGIFQRLYLPPGRHEIALKLEGYRTHKFRVYVPVDQTIKIHHVMERGAGEDSDEVVGSPNDDRYGDRDRNGRYGDRDRDRDDGRYGRRDRDEVEQGEDDRDDAEAGTVRLSLRPSDASVYVDGEFRGSGRRAEVLRLAPGRHRIEVVRPGYHTVEKDVDVRPGDSQTLDIELGR